MANTIKIKRGLNANLANISLAEGEMAFTTDTRKLYISNTDEPINKDTTYQLTKSGSTISLTGSDGSKTSVVDSGQEYSNATTSAAGLMSASDKTKLNGLVASTSTPKAAGTAATGSETGFSRGDHVHPLQTTVSGNAGSATKLATARTLTIGKTGKTFNGTGNVSWSLDEIGSNVYVGTSEPSDSDVDVWIDPSGTIDLSTLWNAVYPIGAIYMSTSSTSPSTLFPGTTWTQITDRFLLAAGSSYSAGNTGGSASTTLATANLPKHTHSFSATSGTQSANHTHSVGAHSHGLNSHTHGIPALSGSTTSTGEHTHQLSFYNYNGGIGTVTGGFNFTYNTAGWFNTQGNYVRQGGHSHNISTTASTSDAASGSTANSSAFTSGSNSANHTHSVSGTTGETGSGTSFTNLPPYLVVYMWKRTA